MRHHVDDLHVALLVAALVRVLSVEFGGVVVDAELGLHPVLGDVHFGARNERVAADGGHLFKEDDVRARGLRFDRRGEARAARTDNDHVVARFLRDGLFDLLDRGLVGLRKRDARLLGGVLHGVEKPLRREGRARNDVEVGGVGRDHGVLQVRVDLGREDLVFLLLDDLDVLDPAVVERDRDRHVAVLADAGAFRRDRGGRERGGEEAVDDRRGDLGAHEHFWGSFL